MFDNSAPKQPVILVVDDAVESIAQLNVGLKAMGTVYFAVDGETALRVARECRPDLVVLDIEMPGMDGYAVCRALKADPMTRHCHVIFITAHDSQEFELESLASGGVDFLSKPFNMAVVRARVGTQLALKRQSDELAQARRDLSDVVYNLPALVAYWDRDLRNGFCNDRDGLWFGVKADAMWGRSLREMVGPDAYAAFERPLAAAMARDSATFEISLVCAEGRDRYAMASLVPSVRDDQVVGFILLLTDISDRRRAEMELYSEKERIRVTLNSIGDAVIATDVDGCITFLNPIAEDMTGWSSKKAIGQPIETVMPLFDGGTGIPMRNPIRLALDEQRTVGMALNCVLAPPGAPLVSVEDSAAPIRDHSGLVTGAIIVFHDVSEAQAMAIKMSHLAQHDPLTDLPNRFLLQDRVGLALQVAARLETRVALLLIDIDEFKVINGSFGHAVGDELIKQIAARLRGKLPVSDTVSRMSGDEFVVLVPSLDAAERADDIGRRLLAALEAPFSIGELRLTITASVGISLYPDDSDSLETLMRHADSAMYRAKQEGRNRCRFFSRAIDESALGRYRARHRLREALERKEFEVYYQTKVDATAGAVVGVEALVRWRTADGTLVPPAEFIPVAEESGLIVSIGRTVLEMACSDAKGWAACGNPLRVSVNISAVQFAEADLPDVVESVLKDTGFPASLLELEITEGLLVKDIEQAQSTLNKLHALGVGVSIDDFGTGYSSLAYLKRFPIDVLKIDQTFVRDMLDDPSDTIIITAIVTLAASLGLDVVAEGVETAAHADALMRLGCTVMQGYYYSRPMPAADIARLLQNRSRQSVV